MGNPVEESQDSQVKDVLLRRTCQQAEIRGLIVDIRQVLIQDDFNNLIKCKQAVENLIVAKDKENLIVGEIRKLAIRLVLDARDIDDQEHHLSEDIRKVLIDANDWMIAIKSLKSKSDTGKSGAVGAIGGKGPDPFSGSTRNYEEIAVERAIVIDQQTVRMAQLEEQLRDMQQQMSDLNSARDEISTLRGVIVNQQEDADKDKKYYQETIQSLRMASEEQPARDASRDTSSPVRTGAPGRRTTAFGDMSRIGIGQDDLLAISHVMQKSNYEMVQSIMQDNRSQQERFYCTMQSPKVEIKKFEGDVTRFQAFINRFDDLVGNTASPYSVKLNTLLQYCGDTVIKYLECCEYQAPKEGYLQARQILKDKYGKPHLVVNAWLERLMSYEKLKTPEDMLLFSSDLRACKKTLETMGCIGELDNTDKKKALLSRMPTYLHNRWRKLVRQANDDGRTASLQQLIDLVSDAADEQADPVYGADSLSKVASLYEVKNKVTVSKKKSFALTANRIDQKQRAIAEPASQGGRAPPRELCACCDKEHYTRRCDVFRAMDSETKLQFARDHKMCILCLSTRHAVDDCQFTWRCQKIPCGGKHNNAFHDALKKEEDAKSFKSDKGISRSLVRSDVFDDDEADQDDEENESLPIMNYTGITRYAMPLTPVYIQGDHGEIATHAFHDTGGGFTIITRKAQQRAGIPITERIKFDAATLFSDKVIDSEVVTFWIRGKGCTKDHLVFNAVVVDQEILDDRYAKILKSMNRWPHIRGINMPVHETNDIDILIGQDNAHIMKREEQVENPIPYSPYAIRTPIGWTVHGYNMEKTKSSMADSRNLLPSYSRPSQIKGDDELLVAAVEKLTQLEQVPDAVMMSYENQEIEKMWEKETRLIDDHVVVPIPFKEGKLDMPNNYNAAAKRLDSLQRRLSRDEKLYSMFVVSMHENFRAGYAEDVTTKSKPGQEWFIPIQPVLSPKKPGKCRIVGDGGHIFMGACLNDAISPGPNYTANVLDILIKFRRFQYVVTGDVKAMYNQVKVPVEQRSCLKFLWFENDDLAGKKTEHQMTTHMFGGCWSAAASIFAMRWLARHLKKDYHPETIDTILKHFYVDDLLRAFIDEIIGARTMTEVIHLLARGSFMLAKISSNSELIMSVIPVECRAEEKEIVNLEMDASPAAQTLGCSWMKKKDTLGFASVTKDVVYTRRGVLSTMSSLFDPLGLVAPFVLLARILLQDICRLGYTWDEVLPEDLQSRWDDWIADLGLITGFSVDRWLGFSGDEKMRYQIHTFMDASENGYGCASYLCIIDGDGEVRDINLVAAKAKVTPIKVITIPRLELCAAVIAVKMNRMIERYLELELCTPVFWSDSTIVLYYVNGKPWQYKTFVANRVVYLQEHTTAMQWRHIDTDRNIADIASRGVTGSELVESRDWLRGPEFLMRVGDWPPPFHTVPDDDIEKTMEMKKISRMNYKMVEVMNPISADLCRLLLTHYSRWNRLLRAVCYLKRSMNYLRDGRKAYLDEPLTAEEVLAAEYRVMILTQEVYITEKQRSSRIFEKLFPFHRGQLTRVGGRLSNSSLAFDEKHPVVFPQCHVQDIFIFHVHERVGHGGVDRTFYEARKRYWLLGGKKSVKKIVDRCVVCKRTRGKFHRQLMAPLPRFRVDEGKVPFQNVGVDFFGPYYVKFGRGLVKRYACMYTDLLMRACHVEVVPDLTASAFLNSLQRFITRRGKPALLVSDNGTNFVGANREMKESVKNWNKKYLGRFMAEEGIKWLFNTPAASHHGGAWERMIRIFRSLAMTVMKNQPLTEDSLRTFTCVIEGIMNSRPLTKLTEDPTDPLPLTPEHLLNLRQAKGLPGDYSKGEVLRQRWGQIQYLGDQFWKRWLDEYLRSLQKRDKWTKDKINVKVGDVVLILDQSLPRMMWPLGLVKEVVLGRDNRVRSVRMKTEKGEMVRPITKIVGLECD